jgi:hypothetical protein
VEILWPLLEARLILWELEVPHWFSQWVPKSLWRIIVVSWLKAHAFEFQIYPCEWFPCWNWDRAWCTEYLLITKFDGHQKRVVEQLPSSQSGLYYMYIKPIDEYVAMKTIFWNAELFQIWHDYLGHLGFNMMRRIINNSASHDVRSFPNPGDFICTACAKGKLITKPSLLKIRD